MNMNASALAGPYNACMLYGQQPTQREHAEEPDNNREMEKKNRPAEIIQKSFHCENGKTHLNVNISENGA